MLKIDDDLYNVTPLNHDDQTLREGYRRMAADKEREAEALIWAEGLIGDSIPTDI